MKSPSAPCSFDGCVRAAKTKGLCHSHYVQRRRGRPLSPLRHQGLPLEERLWPRVNKDGPTMPGMDTPCWLWTGGECGGYGEIRIGLRGPRYGAHRASWVVAHGDVPDGLHVCHRCDNPKCVRPEHLWLGTMAQNMADKMAKGRNRGPARGNNWTCTRPEALPRGEKCRSAKLTEANVVWILGELKRGATSVALARLLGVNPETVRKIAIGKHWTHIPRPV